jgi:hypothetical protein
MKIVKNVMKMSTSSKETAPDVPRNLLDADFIGCTIVE